MENIQQKSMLEVAYELMQGKQKPQSINKLIKETLEMKGIDDPEGEKAAQLYMDITTSSLFVYMGNDEWDLKERQSLAEFDKDGSAFVTVEDEDDDEEYDENYFTVDEEDSSEAETSDLDEDDEDESEETDEEDSLELEDDEDSYQDDDDEDDFLDEKSYNDIMDDYEDMYDK